MADEEKKYLVYLLTNEINGKCYVGRTIRCVLLRWQEHIHASKTSTHLLHRAINKYKAASFSIEVLASVPTKEQMIALERLWIITLGTYLPDVGYNMSYGGEGFGYSAFSKEERKRIGQKISNSLTGKKRNKPSWKTGKTHVECFGEVKARAISLTMSLARKGIPSSKRDKSHVEYYGKEKAQSISSKLSLTHLGKKHNPHNDLTKKKIGVANSSKMRENWANPEYRKSQQVAISNYKPTELHKKNVSEGVRKSWERRRQVA